jgi:hypothetical protein
MNAPKIEERVFLLPDEDKYACAAVRLLHALVLRAGEPALDDGRQGGRTRPPPLELQRARVRGRPRPHTGPVPPADGRRVGALGRETQCAQTEASEGVPSRGCCLAAL